MGGDTQGSLLGSVLVVIYDNDLPEQISNSKEQQSSLVGY